METVHIKTGVKHLTTGKVSAHQRVYSEKGMLFIYFQFKATATIYTADNKKNTHRSCKSLCFNCSTYFFLKYRFCNRYRAPHSAGGKNKGHLALLLMIFPCRHRHLNMTG